MTSQQSLVSHAIQIPLTQGKFAVVDAADFEWLNQWKWHAWYNPTGHTWYARRNYKKKPIHKLLLMHREILQAPRGLQVDHIDGDGLNNRRSNLRLATAQQNQFNARLISTNTSGFRGVSWSKTRKKWQAQTQLNRRRIHLGFFINKEDAAQAYRDFTRPIRGEFARGD